MLVCAAAALTTLQSLARTEVKTTRKRAGCGREGGREEGTATTYKLEWLAAPEIDRPSSAGLDRGGGRKAERQNEECEREILIGDAREITQAASTIENEKLDILSELVNCSSHTCRKLHVIRPFSQVQRWLWFSPLFFPRWRRPRSWRPSVCLFVRVCLNRA